MRLLATAVEGGQVILASISRISLPQGHLVLHRHLGALNRVVVILTDARRGTHSTSVGETEIVALVINALSRHGVINV